MLRLLVLLLLTVRFLLHQRRSDGGDGDGTSDGDGTRDQHHGSIDAGAGVSSAQDTTMDLAQRGRRTETGHQPTSPGQDETGTQWDNTEEGTSPPRPEDLSLSDERRNHIMDGHGEDDGGGHFPGTGKPDKTEFPERWAPEDENRPGDLITQQILDIARNPDEPPFLQDNGNWNVQGTRDGVTVEIIVDSDGNIVTAFPEAGGHGVFKNDENGDPGVYTEDGTLIQPDENGRWFGEDERGDPIEYDEHGNPID
ncbi:MULTISPECIES: EndoU domain-containing protein [Actinoalloteichus]|uniref:Bacterial EndoU nuclease n=1 Tax=Actinoalloteichus fjordicus TaxID=1612552 RepID=A0AAC9LFJ0_9PSEU|nr:MULTISPECIES: EndoU domain-containing protein [Actinoalloteichus]APU15385.1 Bacterial EndoU nuclease [Actinoalloteichus fjordicus]APU21452.1 Bacterial EndoU nuclease [Actinoalloteichus sp. GBA129-24]